MNSDVEQVWRDHLLALACKQRGDGPAKVTSMLGDRAPNPPWEPLSTGDSDRLTEHGSTSVEYRSIE